MTNVLYFPRAHRRASARAKLHTIRLRVLDERNWAYTRHKTQYHVVNARGFPALRGFTDANAKRHRWHSFQVKAHNLERFARGMRSMVDRGLVELRIDGKSLQRGIRRSA